MRDFRKLDVWHEAHQFVIDAYRASSSFPQREAFGITSQLRRSAASIPANIAEGCGRTGEAELTRFLRIAAGSASESEYYLLLAKDLGYLKDDDYKSLEKQVCRLKRMIFGLVNSMNKPRAGSRQPTADSR